MSIGFAKIIQKNGQIGEKTPKFAWSIAGKLQKSVLCVLFDAVGHAVCQYLDAQGGGVEEILRDHAVDILGHRGEEVIEENPQRLQSGHGGGVVGADTLHIVAPHLGGGRGGGGEDHHGGVGLQDLGDPRHLLRVDLYGGEGTVAEEVAHIPEAAVEVDDFSTLQLLAVVVEHPQGVGGETAVVVGTPDGVVGTQQLGDAALVAQANGIAEKDDLFHGVFSLQYIHSATRCHITAYSPSVSLSTAIPLRSSSPVKVLPEIVSL